MKLFVWSRNTGEIEISQTGGVDKKVIHAYADIGKTAAFFDHPTLDFAGVFVHNGKLRARPQLMARINKTSIRADGQDVATIKGVPPGATVIVNDGFSRETHISAGKIINVMTKFPGRYSITIEDFPHMPQKFGIEARPPPWT